MQERLHCRVEAEPRDTPLAQLPERDAGRDFRRYRLKDNIYRVCVFHSRTRGLLLSSLIGSDKYSAGSESIGGPIPNQPRQRKCTAHYNSKLLGTGVKV